MVAPLDRTLPLPVPRTHPSPLRERRQVVCDDPELEALAAAAVHASAQESGHGDLFARIDLAG